MGNKTGPVLFVDRPPSYRKTGDLTVVTFQSGDEYLSVALTFHALVGLWQDGKAAINASCLSPRAAVPLGLKKTKRKDLEN